MSRPPRFPPRFTRRCLHAWFALATTFVLSLGLPPTLGLPSQESPFSHRELAVLFENFDDPTDIGVRGQLMRDERLSRSPRTGPDKSTALRALLIGNEQGSERITHRLALPVSAEEYTLNYDLLLPPDFPFVRGGKLPGLGPLDAVTGGEERRPDGWSARIMFRPGGELESYLYTQDERFRYGERLGSGPYRLPRGRWVGISMHLRLNTPDKADGFVHLYADGSPVVRHENLRFRGNAAPSSQISSLLFHLFYGGHDASWAPRDSKGGYARVSLWLDNLAVYRGRRIRAAAGH